MAVAYKSERILLFLVLLSIVYISFLDVMRTYQDSFMTNLTDTSLEVGNYERHDARLAIQNVISQQRITCGKRLPNASVASFAAPESSMKPWLTNKRFTIVIGHDNMNHVQTNNHINAILHAMDYAIDHNASLALIRNGWATDVLRKLFRGDEDLSMNEWEAKLESKLNLMILDRKEVYKGGNYYDCTNAPCPKIMQYMSGDEMYYYHTTANLSSVIQRRNVVLSFLWTHPTTRNPSAISSPTMSLEGVQKSNVCSTISKSLPDQYVVIHSRWMKKDGCIKRLGRLAHWIKNKTNATIDHKAPCLLSPKYIKSILRSRGALHYPIYIISDGLNNDIIGKLQNHSKFGNNVKTVPQNVSWVGGDMMLGILSSVFIGTPISTLSGNIARARVALGFDPQTNILFPQKMKKNDQKSSEWINSCEDPQCLYDVRFLNHYVG
jgi:hypothetical protein